MRRAQRAAAPTRATSAPRPLGGGSVLLVRGDDGVLRAFANTCRHRGHELLACGAAAQRNVIICPYHSWTYALDGAIRAAAGFKNRPGFAAGEWGLTELPVTEWHGLVFVDGSGNAPPLADSLATLDGLVAPYEMGRLPWPRGTTTTPGPTGRSCPRTTTSATTARPSTPSCARCHPPRSGENYARPGPWIGGWMDLRDGMATMSLDGRSHGVPLRGLDETGLRTVIYVHIFPNVLVSLHPDYVMVHRLVPLAADRTLIECSWAFAPESLRQPGFDPGYAVEFWDITNRQDWHACESVQRGLSSPHAVRAAVPRGGRGLPVRHHGRPRLPRRAGVESGPRRARRANVTVSAGTRQRFAATRRGQAVLSGTEQGLRLDSARTLKAAKTLDRPGR